MNSIPRSALVLGLAGTLPFIWGVVTLLNGDLHVWGRNLLGQNFVGPYVQLTYGTVILSFMSGVLWGFATKAKGNMAAVGYTLSVIPALWAFFATGGGPIGASTNLIFGFLGLLVLDWFFWQQQLAPKWWLKLRLLLTAIVVACLSISVL